MALGGAVEPIDQVGRDLHGRLESDAVIGAADVIVDRFGDADHGHVGHRRTRAHRALTADRHEPVELMHRDRLAHAVDALRRAERLDPGGAQDRAAAGQDASDVVSGQLVGGPLHHAPPAVAEPEDRGRQLVVRMSDHRADRGVQPGAISTAGEQTQSHGAQPTAAPHTPFDTMSAGGMTTCTCSQTSSR